MNLLCVSGNLGKDAVVRKAGDQSVAGFSLAMKSGYGDKAQTIWLDCSLWGKQAESGLVQYLKKGQFVVLSGELGTREHEGKTYLTLRVANVTLGGKSDSAPAQQPTQQQYQQQQHGYNQAPQQPVYNQAPKQQVQHPAEQPQYFEDDIPF